MAEAVHLLSRNDPSPPSKLSNPHFTTAAGETFPSGSAYDDSRGAWVHVFPEACVHQHPELVLRYFKWGISRLILESNPAPRLVPMFIDGNHRIMHETRGKPRWLPRIGKKINVVFGDALDTGRVFGEARDRWRELVHKEEARAKEGGEDILYPMALEEHEEAVALRIEVAEGVRSQVARLRKASGYPDDDPAFARAETWRSKEPQRKQFRSQVDGSIVRRH